MPLFILSTMVGLFVLGLILDDCQERCGRPPRLPLRYEFLAVLIGLAAAILSACLGLIGRRRPPGAKPAR